jgi:hypothetical protein
MRQDETYVDTRCTDRWYLLGSSGARSIRRDTDKRRRKISLEDTGCNRSTPQRSRGQPGRNDTHEPYKRRDDDKQEHRNGLHHGRISKGGLLGVRKTRLARHGIGSGLWCKRGRLSRRRRSFRFRELHVFHPGMHRCQGKWDLLGRLDKSKTSRGRTDYTSIGEEEQEQYYVATRVSRLQDVESRQNWIAHFREGRRPSLLYQQQSSLYPQSTLCQRKRDRLYLKRTCPCGLDRVCMAIRARWKNRWNQSQSASF